MHTILNCSLSNFPSNRLSVVIMISTQTDEIFDLFRKTLLLCTVYTSKTIIVKSLMQVPKVLHISDVYPVKFSSNFPVNFSNRPIERSERDLCLSSGCKSIHFFWLFSLGKISVI